MPTAITHQALCNLARAWLMRPHSAGGPACAVALTECPTGYSGERPDAIGFRCQGAPEDNGSFVVEVKTSRADFLADAKKPHRNSGGVGDWRYFMAPRDLIRIDELPPKWGLLEVMPGMRIKVRAGHALYFKNYGARMREARAWRHEDVDRLREQYLLVRVLANGSDPQKVLDMLRESSRRERLMRSRFQRIGQVLGLSYDGEDVSSALVEQHVQRLARRSGLSIEPSARRRINRKPLPSIQASTNLD